MDCTNIETICLRRGTRLGVAALAVLAALACPPAVLGGKLSAVRSAVRHDSSDEDHDDDHSHGHHGHHGSCQSSHHHCGCDDDGGFVMDFFGTLIWDDDPGPTRYRRVVVEPLPREPSVYDPIAHDTTPAPFASEVTVVPPVCYPEFPYGGGCQPPLPPRGTGRVWFELGSDFDDLDRWSGALMLESDSGWGMDTHWDAYTEDFDFSADDQLRLGDFNLLYRIVETPQSQLRLGVGLNWLSSESQVDAGLNFTTKLDYYPVKPLVVSAEIDWGSLGEADMFHTMVTVGAMVDRFEFFAGFDYRTIGGVELHGPFAGLRIWF